MQPLTKKRLKAFAIDIAVSTVVSLGVETLLRKKIKSEFVHAIVTPTVVMYGLEYVQMRKCGQTLGYKQQGLTLTDEEGNTPTCEQLTKRMFYRDYVSTVKYLTDRKQFEQKEGAILPHDAFTHTVVHEGNTK